MKKTVVILLTVVLLTVLWGCCSPIAEEVPQAPAVEMVEEPTVAVTEEAIQIEEQPAEEAQELPPVEAPAEIPAEALVEVPQEPIQEKVEPVCTISIRCDTILRNLEQCDPEKVSLVPADGWILKPTAVEITPGESVFDVLKRVCQQKKIHLEFSYTPIYDSAYIEGIANLYEFDVGSLSGWMYKVNDWFPNYGCSQHLLQDGDVIAWVYTCDLGRDVGSAVMQNGG